jgi:hypothetical protein
MVVTLGGGFAEALAIEGPLRVSRWALCTRRSRMASAMVGSPMLSSQFSTGTWLVTMGPRRT